MPCESCKRVVASGARSFVLMREERCFGYQNEEDDGTNLGTWKKIDITSESVVNDIATLTSAALNPQRSVFRRVQGASSVGGDLNVELSNNGFAWLIVQAIGKILGAGTAGNPYTILPVDDEGVAKTATAGYKQDTGDYDTDHEITYDPTCSDEDGYADGYYTVDDYGLEPGFTLLISRDGGTIGDETGAAPANHLFFRYSGMRVNTWSVTANPTDVVTSVFGLLGRDEVIVDQAIPTYSEAPEANDPFSGFTAAVEIDGVAKCVLALDFQVNNNLNPDKRCLGDRYRNSLPEQGKEITGTIRMEFTDLIFYTKFLNGTQAILTVEFDLLGDGTETMKVIFPKIEFNGTTPTAAGKEAIDLELPFVGLWDPSPADSILVIGATVNAPDGFDIAIEIVTAGTLI